MWRRACRAFSGGTPWEPASASNPGRKHGYKRAFSGPAPPNTDRLHASPHTRVPPAPPASGKASKGWTVTHDRVCNRARHHGARRANGRRNGQRPRSARRACSRPRLQPHAPRILCSRFADHLRTREGATDRDRRPPTPTAFASRSRARWRQSCRGSRPARSSWFPKRPRPHSTTPAWGGIIGAFLAAVASSAPNAPPASAARHPAANPPGASDRSGRSRARSSHSQRTTTMERAGTERPGRERPNRGSPPGREPGSATFKG